MDDIIPKLRKLLDGEISTDPVARRAVSRDASVYEVIPEAVVSPTGSEDIEKLVKFILKTR